MRTDEQRISKKFKITLVWNSVEDLEDGTKVFHFTDEKTGDGFVHYQVKPSKCVNPTAAKMARAFLTKMKKYEIGNRLKCEAVFREMKDGSIYRDVDSVLYVVDSKEPESNTHMLKQRNTL